MGCSLTARNSLGESLSQIVRVDKNCQRGHLHFSRFQDGFPPIFQPMRIAKTSLPAGANPKSGVNASKPAAVKHIAVENPIRLGNCEVYCRWHDEFLSHEFARLMALYRFRFSHSGSRNYGKSCLSANRSTNHTANLDYAPRYCCRFILPGFLERPNVLDVSVWHHDWLRVGAARAHLDRDGLASGPGWRASRVAGVILRQFRDWLWLRRVSLRAVGV